MASFELCIRGGALSLMCLALVIAMPSLSRADLVAGDVNGDSVVTSGDIIFMVNFVFKGGPSPDPVERADFDSSCTVTSADIITLVNFVFKSGATPQIRCPVAVATNLLIRDAGNAGDGSDVMVSFDKASTENRTSEYRVILVKAGKAGGFDLDSALAVAPANYATITPNDSNHAVRLADSATDSDGDAVVEGTAYTVFTLSAAIVNAGASSLSLPSSQATLVNVAFVRTVAQLPAATGGVDVDASGEIYVADIGAAPSRLGETVWKVTPAGMTSIFAQGHGMLGASGNAFDSNGDLFQSNLSNSTISRITPGGVVTTFATAAQGVAAPVGIAIDAGDTLYVCNCGGNSILKVTPSGAGSILAASVLFACPNGITLADDGNLYVANFSNGSVLQVTLTGLVTNFATVPGNNNGHMVYRDGLFYVAARGAHRVYTIDTLGNVNVLVGLGSRGHDDGDWGVATFSIHNDLQFSPSGDRLYMNEVEPTTGTANIPSRVREIVFPRP